MSATDLGIPAWPMGLGTAKKEALGNLPIMLMDKEIDTGVGHLTCLVTNGNQGQVENFPTRMKLKLCGT